MAPRGIRGLGILVEIIGDATSILRAADSTVSASTKIDAAYKETDKVIEVSAANRANAIRKVIDIQTAAVASSERYLAAQVAGGGDVQAATLAHEAAQAKLNRTTGEGAVVTKKFGDATKTGERDLNKLVRGGLAGSGAFSSLGRSLAFASSGFIAFAAGATLITKSIGAARAFEVAQKQVQRQLEVTGKTWGQYGAQIQDATLKLSHLSGFTQTDLITSFGFLERATGNVDNSLKILSIAADAARATGKPLQAITIALAKAVEGNASALRRLGIVLPKTAKGWDAINLVQQKFAGQAKAGTTAAERFSATFEDTTRIIGTSLLPTVNRLTREFGDYLAKLNETGRLQRDVNSVVHDLGVVFHSVGHAIHAVDEVTGSFKRTLEALVAIKFATLVAGWVDSLVILAAKWGLVGTAATAAGAAQTTALAESGAAGAAGAGAAVGGAEAGAAAGGLAIGLPEIVAIVAAVIADQRLQPQRESLKDKLGPFGFLASGPTDVVKGFAHAARNASDALQKLVGWQKQITAGLTNLPPGSPALLPQPGGSRFQGRARGGGGGRAQPVVFKSFTDTISNQLAQARAALTASTRDDVAAAKAEVAFIKREIAAGHLQGASLIQALQAQASAVSTIQAAEAAAAQKRAAEAQAAAAKIQAQIENSIDPLNLQVDLAREQAQGKSTVKTLKEMRAAARKALASGKLTEQQQLEAWNQIAQLNQQIADATKKQKKKQEQAGKHLYHEINLRQATAGLDLTPQQRRELAARLSQIGPGGTVPHGGTGAFGEIIGPSGRPIHIHNTVKLDGKPVAQNTTKHQQKRRRRNSSQRRGPNAGGTG